MLWLMLLVLMLLVPTMAGVVVWREIRRSPLVEGGEVEFGAQL